WLSPYKAHWQSEFETFDGAADIFTYFFERGLNVLRPGGCLAFITSGRWGRGNFGPPLRGFIAASLRGESIIAFGEFRPFEDAEMIRPTITIVQKRAPGGSMRIYKWLTAGPPPENLSDVIAKAPTMQTGDLGADAWELESDNIIALRKRLSAGGQRL